jgi:hypothetical protein
MTFSTAVTSKTQILYINTSEYNAQSVSGDENADYIWENIQKPWLCLGKYITHYHPAAFSVQVNCLIKLLDHFKA